MDMIEYCMECGEECKGYWADFGVGRNEYWGSTGVDVDVHYVSDCCDADVEEYVDE